MQKCVDIYHSNKQRKPKNIFKQECIPVGCVPSAAVAVSEGGEEVSAHCPGAVHPSDPEADPLPVNRIADRCKNITFV